MRELQLCEMTDLGLAESRRFLFELRSGNNVAFPDSVLTDPRFAKPVSIEISIEQRMFANKRAAGSYLSFRLQDLDARNVIGNFPLWSWIGMFYLEILGERDPNGFIDLRRRPDYAHVIDRNEFSQTRDAHAHRLMHSYELYTTHGNKAWWMLDQPVYAYPGFIQRVIRGPERFRSTGVIDLVHRLYVDPRSKKVSRRASEQNSGDLPGGLLRLNVILDQLSVNYDIYGMDADRIMELLPAEFVPFDGSNAEAA